MVVKEPVVDAQVGFVRVVRVLSLVEPAGVGCELVGVQALGLACLDEGGRGLGDRVERAVAAGGADGLEACRGRRGRVRRTSGARCRGSRRVSRFRPQARGLAASWWTTKAGSLTDSALP